MIPDVHTWQMSTLAIFLDCAPRHMYFLLGGHPQTTLAPCKPRLFPSRQDWAEPVSLEGRLASNVLRKSMLLVFSHPLARERPLPCASSRCRHYCSCIFCGVLASVLSAPLAEFSAPLTDITPPVLADSCPIVCASRDRFFCSHRFVVLAGTHCSTRLHAVCSLNSMRACGHTIVLVVAGQSLVYISPDCIFIYIYIYIYIYVYKYTLSTLVRALLVTSHDLKSRTCCSRASIPPFLAR